MYHTYLHGTSYENAMNIIENGIGRDDRKTIWTCSNPDYIYCIDAKSEDAIHIAIEAGQICAAQLGSNSSTIAVLKIQIPDDIRDELVEPDTSCPRMYNCYQLDIDKLNEYIYNNDVIVNITFYKNSYNTWLRPFYLSGLNQDLIEIHDPLLKDAVNELRVNNIWMDAILDYDRENTETMSLKYKKGV